MNGQTPKPEQPDDDQNPNGSFLRFWAISVVSVVLAIGAINAIVDPYLVTGSPRMKGFNAVKPEIETHGQIAKDYLVRRLHPKGVLLGTSKVDLGINPESNNWPSESRPAFNYGVPGNGTAEFNQNLRLAIASGHVNRVLLLIDIEELLAPAAYSPQSKSRFEETKERVHEVALALFSTDALAASVATIFGQKPREVSDTTNYGQMSDARYRSRAALLGYDAIFVEKEYGVFQRLQDLAQNLKQHPNSQYSGIDDLREIMTLCKEYHINLDIGFAPFHADYLEEIRLAGLWSRYEGAKVALTQLVATQGGANTRLWDFLGYDKFSTEPVPAEGDSVTATSWFWEPSHFKTELGEKILATIYLGAAEYGVRLTPQSVEGDLRSERVGQAEYERSQGAHFRDRLSRAESQSK